MLFCFFEFLKQVVNIVESVKVLATLKHKVHREDRIGRDVILCNLEDTVNLINLVLNNLTTIKFTTSVCV